MTCGTGYKTKPITCRRADNTGFVVSNEVEANAKCAHSPQVPTSIHLHHPTPCEVTCTGQNTICHIANPANVLENECRCAAGFGGSPCVETIASAVTAVALSAETANILSSTAANGGLDRLAEYSMTWVYTPGQGGAALPTPHSGKLYVVFEEGASVSKILLKENIDITAAIATTTFTLPTTLPTTLSSSSPSAPKAQLKLTFTIPNGQDENSTPIVVPSPLSTDRFAVWAYKWGLTPLPACPTIECGQAPDREQSVVCYRDDAAAAPAPAEGQQPQPPQPQEQSHTLCPVDTKPTAMTVTTACPVVGCPVEWLHTECKITTPGTLSTTSLCGCLAGYAGEKTACVGTIPGVVSALTAPTDGLDPGATYTLSWHYTAGTIPHNGKAAVKLYYGAAEGDNNNIFDFGVEVDLLTATSLAVRIPLDAPQSATARFAISYNGQPLATSSTFNIWNYHWVHAPLPAPETCPLLSAGAALACGQVAQVQAVHCVRNNDLSTAASTAEEKCFTLAADKTKPLPLTTQCPTQPITCDAHPHTECKSNVCVCLDGYSRVGGESPSCVGTEEGVVSQLNFAPTTPHHSVLHTMGWTPGQHIPLPTWQYTPGTIVTTGLGTLSLHFGGGATGHSPVVLATQIDVTAAPFSTTITLPHNLAVYTLNSNIVLDIW